MQYEINFHVIEMGNRIKGQTWARIQHQKQSENRENITTKVLLMFKRDVSFGSKSHDLVGEEGFGWLRRRGRLVDGF